MAPPAAETRSESEFSDTSWYARASSVRAESRRLRFELLSAQLDLKLAIFKLTKTLYPSSDPDNAKRLRRTAHSDYSILADRISVAGLSPVQTEYLLGKLDHLGAVLKTLGPREDSSSVSSFPAELPPIPIDRPIVRAFRNADGLTKREVQVLKFIAEGNSTKQVAAKLGISFKTAVSHRSKLMGKLGVHETAALVRYAVRNGIIQP